MAGGPGIVAVVRFGWAGLQLEPPIPQEWLAAGAFGVGFVASSFDADDVANRRFDVIAQRARRMVQKVRAFGGDASSAAASVAGAEHCATV